MKHEKIAVTIVYEAHGSLQNLHMEKKYGQTRRAYCENNSTTATESVTSLLTSSIQAGAIYSVSYLSNVWRHHQVQRWIPQEAPTATLQAIAQGGRIKQ